MDARSAASTGGGRRQDMHVNSSILIEETNR
jgi:hypothetical protein